MSKPQFEMQQRQQLASRTLWFVLLQSLVAAGLILLLAWLTDLSIWVILVVVLTLLMVISLVTGVRRMGTKSEDSGTYSGGNVDPGDSGTYSSGNVDPDDSGVDDHNPRPD